MLAGSGADRLEITQTESRLIFYFVDFADACRGGGIATRRHFWDKCSTASSRVVVGGYTQVFGQKACQCLYRRVMAHVRVGKQPELFTQVS